MDELQAFITRLKAELKQELPMDYIVQAREPDESELKVAEGLQRQVFIVFEGIEPGEDYADMGGNIGLYFILSVACVMRRPRVVYKDGPQAGQTNISASEQAAADILERRLSIIACLQRTMDSFADTHSHVLTGFLEEMPRYVEGYYVAASGVFLRFNLKV